MYSSCLSLTQNAQNTVLTECSPVIRWNCEPSQYGVGLTLSRICAILLRKGLWEAAMDLWSLIRRFEGATLRTLDPTRSQTFTMENVRDEGITLRTTGGSRLFICQEKILDCWSMLIHKKKVNLNLDMHVDLRLGRSASYVAAILAHAPGVVVHTKPIVLEYHTTNLESVT